MSIINKEARMADLIDILYDARSKYYSGEEESPITDAQYDRYLVELANLEEETHTRLYESPTTKVGFEELEGGRIKHYMSILSLKDTKNIDDLLYFLGEREGVLSWKLDGMSIVLYYLDGILQRAVSRGDGHYGKDITRNVILMRNVPKTINMKSMKGEVIIRGEGCLSINEFAHIKKTQEGERFSNPRNMAAGLINATKTSSTLLRHLSFVAHSVILLQGLPWHTTQRTEELAHLRDFGFNVVPYSKVLNFELKHLIEHYTNEVENFEFPVDGLVLTLNDIEYGSSLGATARFPKHSMAFKWPDISALTTVIGMKWSVSGTGLITPVVLFDPVQLEGTIVKQANLHSLRIFEGLGIGIGDSLDVFKANKIVPEVKENLTRSGTEKYPRKCPFCGEDTTVIDGDKTRKLYCYNCADR